MYQKFRSKCFNSLQLVNLGYLEYSLIHLLVRNKLRILFNTFGRRYYLLRTKSNKVMHFTVLLSCCLFFLLIIVGTSSSKAIETCNSRTQTCDTQNNVSKTIRLVFPQWQGGNNPSYIFGAEMLSWLAPKTNDPIIHVPVTSPTDDELKIENGIVGRTQIVSQLKNAVNIIQEHTPDKIVVLGGDCLVELAPFAYLSEKYKDKLGILWIDTHPDVMTPDHYKNAHAHVLGALMGNGDSDLTSAVTFPVKAAKVMIAGIHEPLEYEQSFIKNKNINTCSAEEVKAGSGNIREWIEKEEITHLAIHFDLDVLDPKSFRSLLFSNPAAGDHDLDGISRGQLEIVEVIKIIKEVESLTTVVGLGITEHLPWDAINLKRMLEQLPLLGSQ
jgi:arginase